MLRTMKALLIVISCICFASASFYDALDEESDDVVFEFWSGMDQSPHLTEFVDEFPQEATQVEDDIKTQLAWSMKQVLGKVLEHIRESFEKAEKAVKDMMSKAGKLVDRLKDVSGELRERLQEKVKEWVLIFLEKLPIGNDYGLIRIPLELDEKNVMENIKQNILERLNLKELEEYVKARLASLGQVGRAILELLRRPDGLQLLKDLIQALLPGRTQDYSIADWWKKVKDAFSNLGIKISEKFKNFGSWIQTIYQNGLQHIKDKTQKLRELAKIIASKAATMSKKAALEAWEFLKAHRAEIGEMAFKAAKAALTAYLGSLMG